MWPPPPPHTHTPTLSNHPLLPDCDMGGWLWNMGGWLIYGCLTPPWLSYGWLTDMCVWLWCVRVCDCDMGGWLWCVWLWCVCVTVIWVVDCDVCDCDVCVWLWYGWLTVMCVIVMCVCDCDMGGWLWCVWLWCVCVTVIWVVDCDVCDCDVCMMWYGWLTVMCVIEMCACVWLWYGWLTVMCVCVTVICVWLWYVCDCDMCMRLWYVCDCDMCVWLWYMCDCDMGGWLCYGCLWYRCLRYNHLTVTEVFNSARSNYSKPRSIPSPSLTQEGCCYNDERWKRASRWELNPESSDQDSNALPLSHIPTLKEFMSVVTLAWVSLPPLCCCSNMQEICGPVCETCRCQVTAKHAVHPWPNSNHSTFTGLCYS